MMRVRTLACIVLAIPIALLAISCSDGDSGTSSTATDLQIVSVYPSPGASGVPLDATISMKFSSAMDTTSFHHGFYLSGGSEMLHWMDSVGHHRGMGGRGYQNMQHMYEWMDSISYRGQFHWNGARDSCWFVTDSALIPNARHMILIEGSVHDRHGRMMGPGKGNDFVDYYFMTRPGTAEDRR